MIIHVFVLIFRTGVSNMMLELHRLQECAKSGQCIFVQLEKEEGPDHCTDHCPHADQRIPNKMGVSFPKMIRYDIGARRRLSPKSWEQTKNYVPFYSLGKTLRYILYSTFTILGMEISNHSTEASTSSQ